MIHEPRPVPISNRPISSARANTGSSVASVISEAWVTGHAQMPSGRHSSEPRCDMFANRKPPLP